MFTRRCAGRSWWLELSVLTAAAALGHAAPVHACTAPCGTSVAVPGVSSMPGNLVSFKVTLDDPAVLSLATAGGDPIATHIVTRGGDRIFEPVEPLGAGRDLVLTYTMCPGAEAELHELPFTTDEPSNIELRPSALQVVERGVRYPDLGDQAIAYVRLNYTSPDARGNAAHLFEYRATVDGQRTFVTSAGGVLSVEVDTVCNQYTTDFTPGMCGGLYSVPPGRHVVEVQSHILGQAEDPEPVQLAIETRCPHDVDRDVDSTTSAPDTSDAVDGVNPDGINPIAILEGAGEGNVGAVHADSTSAGSRASGCAFRQSNVSGGAGVLGLVLMLALRRRNPG